MLMDKQIQSIDKRQPTDQMQNINHLDGSWMIHYIVNLIFSHYNFHQLNN